MKERPILFSAPMVRAILAGTKTQTRRIVKPQPDAWCGGTLCVQFTPNDQRLGRLGKPILCPYGVPGDRLWCRESWSYGIHAINSKRDEDGPIVYGATDDPQHRLDGRWRPSIHMPRWASRITLEITDVRVERLQQISQPDAMAEGAPPSHPSIDVVSREYGYEDFSRSWYAQLWEQINGPGSWGANPWVWVVCFRRLP